MTTRAAVLGLLSTVIVAGCSTGVFAPRSAEPSDSAEASPSSPTGASPTWLPSASAADSIASSHAPEPTPSPPPTTTPRPTVPAFTGDPDARTEQDGFIVELWLSDDAVTTRRPLFARVRVTNGSGRTVYRHVDECGNVAMVVLDQRERLERGRDWSGIAATFKERVFEEQQYGLFWFGTVKAGGLTENCEIRPGVVLEEVDALEAQGAVGRPIVPGSAILTATFGYYPDIEHLESMDEAQISISMPIQVEGESTGQRWVSDYIDIALSQPRFIEWLEEQPVRTWINTSVSDWPNELGEMPPRPPYDEATDGTVDVGLFRFRAGSDQYGAVIIDVPTDEILGYRFEP